MPSPKNRKVDTMPDPDTFADKLRKRRMYIEEEGDVEGLQKAQEVMQPKKKKKNGEDED